MRSQLAKTRRRKPSFDLGAESPAPGTAVETGWVYRSTGVSDASDLPPVDSQPLTALDKSSPLSNPPAAPDQRALAAMPSRGRQPIVERIIDWIAKPFALLVMMALVPFGAKQQDANSSRPGVP
jgi:hypothetical protein